MNFGGETGGWESIFGAVLEATALGSILIVLVAVVQWMAGKRLGPSWRFALWGIVLVRLLVPLAPESRWSVFNAAQWFAKEKAAPVVRMQVEPETLVVPEMAGEAVEVQFPAEGPTVASTAEAGTPLPWRVIGMFVWGVGLVWFLGRLMIGSWWLGRKIRVEGQAAKELNEDLDAAVAEMQMARRFRVVETGMVSSPALFGMWRPVLLVPRGFAEQLNARELRHVLLHELAHVKRWDLITNWLMAVAQAVHWFNPLVWLALRQMRVERELACDEMVLRATSEGGEDDGRAYGETILRLLEGVKSRPSLPALVGIAEEKHSARQRILQIVSFDEKKRGLRWLGLMLVAILGVGGLTNAEIRKSDAATTQAEEAAAGAISSATKERKISQDDATALADRLRTLKFPDSSLEGKTVAEVIKTMQMAYPKELSEVRFIWRVAHILTTEPGTVANSGNAVGYLDMLVEFAAKDLQLTHVNLRNSPEEEPQKDKLEVKNRSVLSVLQLITRSVNRGVALEFEPPNNVVFSTFDPSVAARWIDEARVAMERGWLDEAEQKLQRILRAEPEHRAAKYFSTLLQERRVRQESQKDGARVQERARLLPPGTRVAHREIVSIADRPPNPYARTNRIGSSSDEANELDAREAELLQALKTNPNDSSAVNLLVELRNKRYVAEAGKRQVNPRQSPTGGRAKLVKKLNELLVDYYELPDGLPLSEVIKDIHRLARKLDPEKVGVNFLVSGRLDKLRVEETGTGFEPLSGRPKLPLDVADYVVKISPPLRNVTLLGLINAIVEVAKPPAEYEGAPALRYSVEDYGIVFGLRAREAEPLYTRTFRVDPNTFIQGLQPVVDINQVLQGSGADRGARVQEAVKEFFTAAGINFGTGEHLINLQAGGVPPPQKAIFYNDRTGILMTRATLADMELIEKALQTMKAADEEQLVMEVAAVEVKSREELSKLIRMMNIRGEFRTTLTTAEFGPMERTATNGGFRWLNMPRVTTLNGRPARVSKKEELKLSVDLTCKYQENNKTVQVAASSTDPKSGRSETKSGVVYDRQTFVLMPDMEGGMLKPARVVFITPSLIDAAGNLKNTGDDQFIELIGREVPKE